MDTSDETAEFTLCHPQAYRTGIIPQVNKKLAEVRDYAPDDRPFRSAASRVARLTGLNRPLFPHSAESQRQVGNTGNAFNIFTWIGCDQVQLMPKRLDPFDPAAGGRRPADA